MDLSELAQLVVSRRNFLCVGLDVSPGQLPSGERSLRGVEKAILSVVEATVASCVSYKVNFAFFERWGAEGYRLLERVRSRLPEGHFLIADAKRCDIPSTMEQYVHYAVDVLGFHALTTYPWMGRTAMEVIMERAVAVPVLLPSERWIFDSWWKSDCGGEPLWWKLLRWAANEFPSDRVMVVIGATLPGQVLDEARRVLAEHWWLVPGVGVQGGRLEEVWESGTGGKEGRLLACVSRGIFAPEGCLLSVGEIEERARTLALLCASLMAGGYDSKGQA